MLFWLAPSTLCAQVQLQRLDLLTGGQMIGATLALPLAYPAEAVLNKRWELRTIRFSLPNATLRLSLQGAIFLETTRLTSGFRVLYDSERRIVQIGEVAIHYHAEGRLQKLGEIEIAYDKLGQINKLGDLLIERDINQRLLRMGRLRLRYDSNNLPAQIGKQRLRYDDIGRLAQVGTLKLQYHAQDGRLLAVEGKAPQPRIIAHWNLDEACQRLRYGN
jgi:hypothetical protein